MLSFSLLKRSPNCKARLGRITTAHGTIHTPIFMPVATLATLRTIHTKELLHTINASIILSNTYHLYLRPSIELLEKAGGLHRFMGWSKPILTDSGGFQLYSLADRCKIDEKGFSFFSHIDGTKHRFTPESCIARQKKIGADIIMPLDICTAFPCSYSDAKKSMEITHDWLEMSWIAHQKIKPFYGYPQALFPIVQGSIYQDLREEATKHVQRYPAIGYAIGGVCHPNNELYKVTSWVCNKLPETSARYLMGVGKPANLLHAIARGIDMFDCVLPARNGRHGTLYTHDGELDIKQKKWSEDFSPIDEKTDNGTSPFYTKAYLYHLFKSKQPLASRLGSLQNLSFFIQLMEESRKAIERGDFLDWMKKKLKKIEKKR